MRRLTPFLLVAAAGCGTVNYDYSKEPDPRKGEYIIGASDRLRVTVWKNPELSAEGTVRPDGTFTLPLIGDTQVSGLTPSQVKKEVTSRLANFVRDDAVVTIAVIDANSYRFTVSGSFEHPGIFTSKYYVTVAEAGAMAGGPNKFCDPRKLYLVRPGRGAKPRKVPIDWNRVSSGEHPEENIAVVPGDTLFCP